MAPWHPAQRLSKNPDGKDWCAISPGKNVISSRCHRGRLQLLRLAVVGEMQDNRQPAGDAEVRRPVRQ